MGMAIVLVAIVFPVFAEVDWLGIKSPNPDLIHLSSSIIEGLRPALFYLTPLLGPLVTLPDMPVTGIDIGDR